MDANEFFDLLTHAHAVLGYVFELETGINLVNGVAQPRRCIRFYDPEISLRSLYPVEVVALTRRRHCGLLEAQHPVGPSRAGQALGLPVTMHRQLLAAGEAFTGFDVELRAQLLVCVGLEGAL